MKKIVSYLLIVVTIMSFISTTGCKEKFSQEEFRVEYIDKLNRMGVKKNTTEDLPDSALLRCDVIADDLIIISGLLELYVHCYEIYEPDREKITYDEIVSLYSVYDEEIYQKFYQFYAWLCINNGHDFVDRYRDAMFTANELYKEKYGEGFFPDTRESNWTVEQRISFEEFIRNNPDFMTEEEYSWELTWLGIIELT